MEIEEIKRLLTDPKVKAIVEAEIVNAVSDKQKELEESKAALETELKRAKKELFIFKKTILAKSQMSEEKMKSVYESKLQMAVDKISKDVFSFIGSSIKSLTESVAKDTKEATDTEKIIESFHQAMKIMAPYLNVKELAESNASVIEEYKTKINNLSKEVIGLRGKVLSDDINSLVVKECVGYPFEHQVVVVNTLKEIGPKSLTEAKEVITTVKEKLRERMSEKTETKEETLKEEKTKLNADDIKKDLLKIVTEMKEGSKKLEETLPKKTLKVSDPFDMM